MLTENYPNLKPRQESDREQIATIIQRGHIERRTSDEIAGEVIDFVNKRLEQTYSQKYLTISLT